MSCGGVIKNILIILKNDTKWDEMERDGTVSFVVYYTCHHWMSEKSASRVIRIRGVFRGRAMQGAVRRVAPSTLKKQYTQNRCGSEKRDETQKKWNSKHAATRMKRMEQGKTGDTKK